MDAQLPEMKSFVLPGGHTTISYCHVSRCVCRRSERLVTHLTEVVSIEAVILSYLNRLSDYLFVLARKLTQDLNATETPWKPRM
jgi:cob(I)alamin adenosyltransferase